MWLAGSFQSFWREFTRTEPEQDGAKEPTGRQVDWAEHRRRAIDRLVELKDRGYRILYVEPQAEQERNDAHMKWAALVCGDLEELFTLGHRSKFEHDLLLPVLHPDDMKRKVLDGNMILRRMLERLQAIIDEETGKLRVVS